MILFFIVLQDKDGAIVVKDPGGFAFRVYDRTTGRTGRKILNRLILISCKCVCMSVCMYVCVVCVHVVCMYIYIYKHV